MTDMRYKIAGIVRQAIYDHEAYIDSPEIIAASAIMALQQATNRRDERMSDADLEELIADSKFLTCLMEMQVHTWEGYEAAWEMFNDMEDTNND